MHDIEKIGRTMKRINDRLKIQRTREAEHDGDAQKTQRRLLAAPEPSNP
jgi:hypothetical protein